MKNNSVHQNATQSQNQNRSVPSHQTPPIATGGVRSGHQINCVATDNANKSSSSQVQVFAELHQPSLSQPIEDHNEIQLASFSTGGEHQLSSTMPLGPTNILVMSAKCIAFGPAGSKIVGIFFDSGADVSFVRTETAKELNLPIVKTSIFSCVGVQGRSEPSCEYAMVNCQLQALHGGPVFDCQFWSMETLCAPLKPRRLPDMPVLDTLCLADDFEPGIVDIIIGTDVYYTFLGQQHIQLTQNLRAVSTSFGWVIHGKSDDYDLPFDPTHHASTLSIYRAQLSSAWELEGIGIQSDEPESDAIIPQPTWNEEESKFEAKLLWKSDDRPVPNFEKSLTRVERTLSKLSTSQPQQYDSFMESKLSENIIAESPPEWKDLTKQFFLPHRALFDGKFRVVFDGSALDGIGKPLNSYMTAGPNMLPKLLSILLRFRIKKIGMQADVKGAFHQISLPEEDRPFVQFIYHDKIFHWRRLPYGLVCSPSLLHASIDCLLTNTNQ